MSRFFVRTLREDPADAEVTSHRLLVRAGYIRRQAPGIFAWLPLGLRVRARIETIIRAEMERAGAQEVLFPALLPREPYDATGRWEEYGDGIFRLQDRKGADYLLAPTHEEVFTLLVKDLFSSHKDLPLTIYQIQDKYRDEARPRAGLLRGREFSMKDAYSFDLDDEGLSASYQAQRDAYERIFTGLGLEYVIVQADAGAMGGSRSEEFLHPTLVGEDSFVRSAGGYAANVEAYRTPPTPPLAYTDSPKPIIRSTPNTPNILSLLSHANTEFPRQDRAWESADTLKNVVLALTNPDGAREIVVVALPGDREVDLKRAEVWFAPATVEPANDTDFAAHPALVKGYIGPYSESGALLGSTSKSRIRYLGDPRVADGTVWITGAGKAEQHVFGLVAGRDFRFDADADIAEVRDGDQAPDGSGPVVIARGMELGHVFELGRKYAQALGLAVQDEDGKLSTVTMGSYGIGVTRVLAAIAEACADDKGLCWPAAIAPFDIHLVATGKDESVSKLAMQLVEKLESIGLSVLYDDRAKLSAGVKFRDAELIGIPTIVVVGRGAAKGLVELWDRKSGERAEVAVNELLERLS